ncbi:MAG: 50S ribosomal protein L29 [Gammaproteobacteria bacterium]
MSKIVMRRGELREKTPDTLREELTALRREHFNLRMQKAAQQSGKTSELRRVRRDLARAQTILRQQHQASS